MNDLRFLSDDNGHVILRISYDDMLTQVSYLAKTLQLSNHEAGLRFLAAAHAVAVERFGLKGKLELQIVEG